MNGGGPDFGGESEINRREAAWDEVQATGVKTFRQRFDWLSVSGTCSSGTYNFAPFDDVVRRAANRGITMVAYLYGMPAGCETGNQEFPLPGTANYKAWIDPNGFVARVVKRYGDKGSFWTENPSVPYHPIGVWEVWNEPNHPENNAGKVVRPQQYARFLIDTSATIRSAQAAISSSFQPKILIGGLSTFKEDLSPSSFISVIHKEPIESGAGAYTAAELRASFDGAGSHPYVLSGNAKAAEEKVLEVRSALNSNGDSAKTIWVTELGWPVGEFGITEALQAQYLDESFQWLASHASEDKIELAAWFQLRDTNTLGNWADKTGLKTIDQAYRTSWCKLLALNGRSCALTVAQGTKPSIARDQGTGYIAMAYRNVNGGISYTYKAPGEGWVSFPLGGSVAANTSPSLSRDPISGYTFIAYQNASGGISYWYWTQTEGWVNGTLGGKAAAGSSPALAWASNFAGIVYRDSKGKLAYWYWSGGTWTNMNLLGSVAAETSPSISRDPTSGYTFITYRTPTGTLGYTLWSQSTGWVGSTLGGAPVAAKTSPSVVRSESAQHIFIAYTNSSSGISYWYWTQTEGWVGSTLGGSAWITASPSLVWDPNFAGIVFRNSSQGLSEWSWVWPTGWTLFNVPTKGWLSSDPTYVRDPASTNASIAYGNQSIEGLGSAPQLTNISWIYEIPGSWVQIVP